MYVDDGSVSGKVNLKPIFAPDALNRDISLINQFLIKGFRIGVKNILTGKLYLSFIVFALHLFLSKNTIIQDNHIEKMVCYIVP